MAESLAGERLGGGSQRLQMPRLKINEGDRRETVAIFRVHDLRWEIGRIAKSCRRICST